MVLNFISLLFPFTHRKHFFPNRHYNITNKVQEKNLKYFRPTVWIYLNFKSNSSVGIIYNTLILFHRSAIIYMCVCLYMYQKIQWEFSKPILTILAMKSGRNTIRYKQYDGTGIVCTYTRVCMTCWFTKRHFFCSNSPVEENHAQSRLFFTVFHISRWYSKSIWNVTKKIWPNTSIVWVKYFPNLHCSQLLSCMHSFLYNKSKFTRRTC